MNNDLNKQLCELCGIKPRYGIYVDYGDLDHNYKLETNERKYRLIADYRWYYSVDDEDLRDLKPEFYPDFTKPENFVRLVNLIYTCGINQTFDYQLATLSAEEDEDYSDYESSETFEQRYLQVLLYTLAKNYDHWDELFFSLVSKSIREAEWVYD